MRATSKEIAAVAELIRVGIVGTGYAAKLRAAAFQEDSRSQVVAIAGRTLESAIAVAETHAIPQPLDDWQPLIQQTEVDLVVVCHANCGHREVVHAALMAGKAVVVEYPLALTVADAQALIQLAEAQGLLLHVEHIELLGGLHQAMQAHLPEIGAPSAVRYATVVPQRPAPQRWTYHAEQFGFPLVGALSRVHRLTNLFGPVRQVTCQLSYDDQGPLSIGRYFKTCRCAAQLIFTNGVIAEVLYGKGEHLWEPQRRMEVQGSAGALIFEGDAGVLIQPEQQRPIEVGGRRGLFAKDTAQVLDALLDGKPLYVTPQDSLAALRVAAAAQQAAETGQAVHL
ncbi:MAG: Gfo/Idh/MocA family oxidoreductase [Leptolyngbyaceae cyanobacterium T60_A2020_046]|nr:Gfo/Idh/MocA family oxidoreductase [Leptolyngbyaceae cyanobacterium T60_A2020_046]